MIIKATTAKQFNTISKNRFEKMIISFRLLLNYYFIDIFLDIYFTGCFYLSEVYLTEWLIFLCRR